MNYNNYTTSNYPDFSSDTTHNNGNGNQSAVTSSGSNTATSSTSNYIFNSPLTNYTSLNKRLSPSSFQSQLFSSQSGFNNSNSILNARQRFIHSKGFDIEDDLEFCPEIHDYQHQQHQHHQQQQAQQAHKFNPYTSSTFSPISPNQSLASGGNVPLSPSFKKATPVQQVNAPSSPRINTPRTKKALEIINPLTGTKVGSPAPQVK